MKRLALGLLVALIMLGGCGSKTVTPKIEGIKADIAVKYDDMELSGTMNFSAGGIFVIEIEEPQSLNGMVFNWNGTECEIEYRGLKVNLGSEELPNISFASSIRSALTAALRSQEVSLDRSETGIVEGNTDLGKFSLTVDKNGFPIKLSVPTASLTVEFSNINVSN